MTTRRQIPCDHVYEIDSGEGSIGAEVGGRHLWLIISDLSLRRDRLVVGLPLTGRDEKRTNFDVPFRPDDIDALREPKGMSLKTDGLCYVLTAKPRHFDVSRLPATPYGKMAPPVVHTALQRMGSALLLRVSPTKYDPHIQLGTSPTAAARASGRFAPRGWLYAGACVAPW
ncbi:type II toxin-antitoxin system PemK/MazF family toxin [Enhygromyxa salina]|uniref:type II toxin-antitoxin system PemK/MazF family toxin n=1 Tax=Enhygromyxa salina TaxID=215803 RepID=UPI0011B2282F